MANGKVNRERARDSLKKAVRNGAKGLRDWRRWWLKMTFVLVLIILGISVAFMLNPSTSSANLPIKDEDVGKVASVDIKAAESFNVVDEESTERLRREAEESIRAVYDFELEMGQERIRRLQEAFGDMQALVRQHEAERRSLQPDEDAESGYDKDGKEAKSERDGDEVRVRKVRKENKKARGEAEADQEASRAKLEQELSERLDEGRGEFLKNLQVVVKEEDFLKLRDDRFSQDSLTAISRLVERTMRHMIVNSRELLEADRGKSITVRFQRGGIPDRELVVSSFTRVLDLEAAQEKVEQAALLELGQVEASLRNTYVRLAKALITPNLFFNRNETKRRQAEARNAVKERTVSVQKNAIIIRKGDVIDKGHVQVFRAMQRELRGRADAGSSAQMSIGAILLVVLMLAFLVNFAGGNIRKFRTDTKDLALLALMLFVTLVSVKVWFWVFGAVFEQFKIFPLESYYYAIPFAAGAMLIRFVLNSEMALAFAIPTALLSGLLVEDFFVFGTYCMVSSVVAAGAVSNVNQRTSLLKAGAVTGLANVALVISIALFKGSFFSAQTISSSFFAFSGGILVAIIVTGVAPVIEVLFGYTTNIKLLELANLNHPLLKELIVQAPGSYHHSIIVGSLVEAAAEATHCNPLLARVMAYYHDIGKIKKPDYFSENQRDGVNRHDKIKPSLSAAVLKAHVKDGAELGRQSRLGAPILDAITQHHGTSLIKFFYQRAKDQAEESETIVEDDFRYPGPKPKTREVALVLLADSVEAAAKSISDPSPARLQGLVQNIINRIFADGQLSDCDLTLKDLHEIARAFNRVLAGIYHYRPDYPESATKDREAAEKRSKSSDKIPVAKKETSDPPPREGPPEAEGEKSEDLKRLGM